MTSIYFGLLVALLMLCWGAWFIGWGVLGYLKARRIDRLFKELSASISSIPSQPKPFYIVPKNPSIEVHITGIHLPTKHPRKREKKYPKRVRKGTATKSQRKARS